jgi:hypothetical protein
LRVAGITYRFFQGGRLQMGMQWDRAVVVATLAMAIIVCLWGIKILVMA